MTNQIPILLSEYTRIVILPSCLLLLKVRRANSQELRTYTTDFLYFISFYFLSFAFFSKRVTFGFGTSGFSGSRSLNLVIFNLLIFPKFKAPISCARLVPNCQQLKWNHIPFEKDFESHGLRQSGAREEIVD